MTHFHADSEGNVPLWDAILGKHEPVIKLLTDNGATLSSGDVGHFACFAAEQNDIELLKKITTFGGDVTLRSTLGTTALHTAVSEENIEIVKYLIEQGADVDKADSHEWTPRTLADHRSNDELKELFKTIKKKPQDENIHQKGESIPAAPEAKEAPYLKKYSIESPNPNLERLSSRELRLSKNMLRRRPSDFQNSLAGIIKAGQIQNEGGRGMFAGCNNVGAGAGAGRGSARVTVSCPEKGDRAGRLVLLPGSLEELLGLGHQKYGFDATRILTKDGYVIGDLSVIRDGDHLVLASGDATHRSSAVSS